VLSQGKVFPLVVLEKTERQLLVDMVHELKHINKELQRIRTVNTPATQPRFYTKTVTYTSVDDFEEVAALSADVAGWKLHNTNAVEAVNYSYQKSASGNEFGLLGAGASISESTNPPGVYCRRIVGSVVSPTVVLEVWYYKEFALPVKTPTRTFVAKAMQDRLADIEMGGYFVEDDEEEGVVGEEAEESSDPISILGRLAGGGVK